MTRIVECERGSSFTTEDTEIHRGRCERNDWLPTLSQVRDQGGQAE